MKTCRCGRKALYIFEPDLRLLHKPSGTIEKGSYVDILCSRCCTKARCKQWANGGSYRSEVIYDA